MADHTHLVRTHALGVPLRGRFRRCDRAMEKVPCSGERLGSRRGHRLSLSPSLPLPLIHASVCSLRPADDGPAYVFQAWVTCRCASVPFIDLGAVQEQRSQESSHSYDIAQPREHQRHRQEHSFDIRCHKIHEATSYDADTMHPHHDVLALGRDGAAALRSGWGQQKFEGKQLQGAS